MRSQKFFLFQYNKKHETYSILLDGEQMRIRKWKKRNKKNFYGKERHIVQVLAQIVLIKVNSHAILILQSYVVRLVYNKIATYYNLLPMAYKINLICYSACGK